MKQTCQICGREIKLQNPRSAVLADHGFNLKYQFRSGCCYGSGCLPYEKSCDVIVEYLSKLKDAIDQTESQFKTISENIDVRFASREDRHRYYEIMKRLQSLKKQKEYLAKRLEEWYSEFGNGGKHD